MAVTVSQLMQGPAELFAGLFGATEPTHATATITSPTPWRDLGGTDGGVRQVMGMTFSNMEVDQIAMPVGARKVGMMVQIATTLAEATLENYRTALNDAAGTGDTYEPDAEITNAEPNYSAVLLRGTKPGGGKRLVIIRRALVTENVESAWTKDSKTVIPVTFTGYYVSSSIKPYKIDDRQTAPV